MGANRLTRQFFHDEGPPSTWSLRAVRRKVRHQLRDVAERVRWVGPSTAV
ncbi:hypothetical protein [Streptomyces chartreusis]